MMQKEFMLKLCDEFKDFVSDSMNEGLLHEHYEDHMEFLADCLTTFIELKSDAES